MDRPTCKTCPYWWLMNWENSDFIRGHCRINPPSDFPAYADEDKTATWPLTLSDDGCGHHPDYDKYVDAFAKFDDSAKNPIPGHDG